MSNLMLVVWLHRLCMCKQGWQVRAKIGSRPRMLRSYCLPAIGFTPSTWNEHLRRNPKRMSTYLVPGYLHPAA